MFTEASKQDAPVLLDNRQMIPGWGAPIGPWGGWPWYGGMSTVMFAALIYSLSVLPAMMTLFSKFRYVPSQLSNSHIIISLDIEKNNACINS